MTEAEPGAAQPTAGEVGVHRQPVTEPVIDTESLNAVTQRRAVETAETPETAEAAESAEGGEPGGTRSDTTRGVPAGPASRAGERANGRGETPASPGTRTAEALERRRRGRDAGESAGSGWTGSSHREGERHMNDHTGAGGAANEDRGTTRTQARDLAKDEAEDRDEISEVREEIERTRDHLGDTIEALAAKADVRARAQERVHETAMAARAKAAGMADRVREATPAQVRDTAVKAAQGAKRRPGVLAAAGAAVTGLLVLRRFTRARAGRRTPYARAAGGRALLRGMGRTPFKGRTRGDMIARRVREIRGMGGTRAGMITRGMRRAGLMGGRRGGVIARVTGRTGLFGTRRGAIERGMRAPMTRAMRKMEAIKATRRRRFAG
ncbi:hypothetical protein GCM10009530_18840 [Microbispora corallina]|uniref:DUF3618 domain-containing protein n=1 Tax=Microbispora corallina TaxID=83302 RepID=A0ABQ4FUF9_9ACTN|nr:DUF3618 domain-containing protein [Microbispora corallina]GIH38457.1 hypothetical protein Mco01_14570 [Microbispora corallina]